MAAAVIISYVNTMQGRELGYVRTVASFACLSTRERLILWSFVTVPENSRKSAEPHDTEN